MTLRGHSRRFNSHGSHHEHRCDGFLEQIQMITRVKTLAVLRLRTLGCERSLPSREEV